MTTKLRLVGILLSVSVLASCAAPAQDPPDDDPSLGWAEAEQFLSYASDIVSDSFAEGLGERMLAASDGRIYCNTYTDSQLGTADDLLRCAQNGTLSIVQSSTSAQMALVPQLALLDTPYLFSDIDSCNALLDEKLVDFFQPYYQQAGLQLLALSCRNFRELSCTFPLETPEQLADLKIRIMDNPYHQLYWSAVGAEPTVISFSKLFYAAQQGIINAQENPASTTLTLGLQQLQPYLIRTDHIPYISAMVMNRELYDSLSPENQEAVLTVFQQNADFRGQPPTQEELEENFQAVLTPSDELREALQAGAEVVRQALAEDLGAEVTEAFYALTASQPVS
jgi:TRAP-type C4-dicarboxylate transport system substrate-binding protein